MVLPSTVVSDGGVLPELSANDEIVLSDPGVVEVVRPPIRHGL